MCCYGRERWASDGAASALAPLQRNHLGGSHLALTGASFTEALAQRVEQGGKLSDLNPESG